MNSAVSGMSALAMPIELCSTNTLTTKEDLRLLKVWWYWVRQLRLGILNSIASRNQYLS